MAGCNAGPNQREQYELKRFELLQVLYQLGESGPATAGTPSLSQPCTTDVTATEWMRAFPVSSSASLVQLCTVFSVIPAELCCVYPVELAERLGDYRTRIQHWLRCDPARLVSLLYHPAVHRNLAKSNHAHRMRAPCTTGYLPIMGGDFESTHMRAQVDDEREAEAAGDEAHCTFLLRLCQVCASEAQHSAHIHDR